MYEDIDSIPEVDITEIFNKYLKDFELNGWEKGNDWEYVGDYIIYIQNNTYSFFADIHDLYCGISEYEKSNKNNPNVQMGRKTFELMYGMYGYEYMLNSLRDVFRSAIITYIMKDNSFSDNNSELYHEVKSLAAVVFVVYTKIDDLFKH